jgi:hypothetical protein
LDSRQLRGETVTKVKPLKLDARLVALQAGIDEHARIFATLVPGARTLEQYLATRPSRADEEILTEPILRGMIGRVLGFETGRILEQLGASGRKPDFTPEDLIAHSFVFDAKSSDENLARHEAQIRGYMDQRRLDYGVLFNLREVRVFARAGRGHEPNLSFPILPLWHEARGEALPGEEYERFLAFCSHFSFREVTLKQKAKYIAQQEPWSQRFALGESLEIDVDALVERLRRLSVDLADDARAQVEQVEDFVALNESRARSLQEELELLAEDVAPGTNPEMLPTTIEGWRSSKGVAGSVWSRYLQRVAYLTLARILLYRAWEDVEFTRSYLYDGGFDQWYEALGGNARDLLDEAFAHGAQRYSWLFGRENNYAWYRPREKAIVDVLYALAPEPLGKLDADVLGSLYATYAQEIDRDRLGQFFTPRDVVRFMLDRVGFSGADGVFRVEGNARKPRRILDFATGSGGFLVESARRIIDAVGAEKADPPALREALEAIVVGLAGGEISPFPYYLTEITCCSRSRESSGRFMPRTTIRRRSARSACCRSTRSRPSGQSTRASSWTPSFERIGPRRSSTNGSASCRSTATSGASTATACGRTKASTSWWGTRHTSQRRATSRCSIGSGRSPPGAASTVANGTTSTTSSGSRSRSSLREGDSASSLLPDG